jgi:cyclic pyranopterin phosphate synthase
MTEGGNSALGRPTSRALLDRFGRLHSYLRISVTDRCNFRCVYCLPAEGASWMPRRELLAYEEIARIVRVMAGMGLRRVRLTGGEPTVRRDIEQLVGAIASVDGIEDLSMTTNAHRFAAQAGALKAAGLRRVNISLDSLDPARFSSITRGGELAAVLQGVEAARNAGLAPIKLNAVVMRGVNDDEVVSMVEHFLEHAGDTVLRFIEYMPFEGRWHQNVPAAEMRARLEERFGRLTPVNESLGGGPASYWRVDGLTVGFIAPLTEHFCAKCNRLRLLADGHLRTCLAHENTPSLRDVLRSGASDAELEALLRSIVLGKPAGHEAETEGGVPFQGVMTAIGG